MSSSPARYYSGQFSASSSNLNPDSHHPLDPQFNGPSNSRSQSPRPQSPRPYSPQPAAAYPSQDAYHSISDEQLHDRLNEKTEYDPDFDRHSVVRVRQGGWPRRKKLIVIGSVVGGIALLALILGLGLGLGLKKSSPYNYVPSTNQVTNATAFTEGGATRKDPADTNDGIGAGQDKYTYYSGPAENFPAASQWISFENLWSGNMHSIQTSCKINYQAKDNTEKEITDIYNAIQSRARASLVDHRFILAVILQETAGCVRAGTTKSSTGVANPGIMQTHDGHSFDSHHANASIYQMVQDGTQGTDKGSGLVQNLDLYGNLYRAARGYNSGYIPTNGNLSDAAGATACYVSDIANRLTGWANATRGCHESS